MGSTLDCKKATRLLLEAEERPLVPSEVEALEFHLKRCLCCENFKDQLSFMQRVAEYYAGPR